MLPTPGSERTVGVESTTNTDGIGDADRGPIFGTLLEAVAVRIAGACDDARRTCSVQVGSLSRYAMRAN